MYNIYMDVMEQKGRLLGSLLLFTQVFYKLRTGREFEISEPIARESHHRIISKELTRTSYHKLTRLIINCPPRYGKTELAIHYIAWMLARYPDSNFLYISYSHSLAKKQTQTIRNIVNLEMYKNIFGVRISSQSSAKDNFETTAGGSVYASGSGGTITGRGAGIQNCERFGGAIVIDDIAKPSEMTSETIRESIQDWYLNTLQSRVNNPKTPIIFIGQRLHEDDLVSYLVNKDKRSGWNREVIPALDIANNALNPKMHTKEVLLEMKDCMPYEFSSQYQQEPQPAGGSLFKDEWIRRKWEEPNILSTFITCDTAETDKTYNDATVFSFWGLYKIIQEEIEIDIFGLHWIDCHECWVQPKDLKDEFFSFYHECMRYEVKPYMAAIEKKSTGTTLVSCLKDIQGLQIIDIERNRHSKKEKVSGNKISRFLDVQSYVASGRISITRYSDHEEKVTNHIKKITANNSHRYDDIADTMTDAIKLALIDKVVLTHYDRKDASDQILASMAQNFNRRNKIIQKSWHR